MTTNNNTEPLLHSRVSYPWSLSRVNDKLKSFQSSLRWICVDQFDTRYVVDS
ncbi:hypothetical protein GW17_00054693 [Ensete ventricosum]|nr:hypothetical protein GW17_00054693 [Ensete ventricosum]